MVHNSIPLYKRFILIIFYLFRGIQIYIYIYIYVYINKYKSILIFKISMAKSVNIYTCQECGAQHPKWVGRCDECNKWNSVIEEVSDHISFTLPQNKNTSYNGNIALTEITDLGINSSNDDVITERYDIGIGEFNRVLGGGIVQGSTILLCGEPGIGKSTLLLQLCHTANKNKFTCFYISGEESAMQIKMRANRLRVVGENIKIAISTSITEITTIIKHLIPPAIVIIDSIQTLYSEMIQSSPGTVSQVKACAFELIKIAKQKNISLIIVGHITKDGQIAGPKVLEHMVDTVLYFEGDSTQQYRIVRAVKNRYGSTNEIGVFEMNSNGLNEIDNPSKLFMSDRDNDISGSCIFAGIEGSRSLLVEVQSLVVPSFLATPRRSAIGWDTNRLAMILAILNARLNINMMDKEVYLNIAGGLKIVEPAIDLAVLVSLVSAVRDINIPRDTVFFGEIGLSGELRQVVQVESRINEAVKLGFKHIIMSYDNKEYDPKIKITKIKYVGDLLKYFINLKRNSESNR